MRNKISIKKGKGVFDTECLYVWTIYPVIQIAIFSNLNLTLLKVFDLRTQKI